MQELNEASQANEMTRDEAERSNLAIKAGILSIRALLLDMRDRKGWKALGYESFDAYGKAELGYERSHLYELASAAEVEKSLISVRNCGQNNIPESQLRPLAPLSNEERQKVWEEATARAEEESRKLTAKIVQEAVENLKKEKDLANQRLDSWRSQAVAEKKAREDAEAAAKLKANELAKLRGSIEKSANDLAAIRTGELKAELDRAKIDKAELEQKLKAAKKEREDAINRGVTNRLREQQDQVSRLENQLQALEHHRTALQRQIEPMAQSAASAAHHDKHVKALDHLLNQASLEIVDAFDPDFCAGLPAHYTEIWGKGLDKLRQLASMLEQQLDAVNVMRLERAL